MSDLGLLASCVGITILLHLGASTDDVLSSQLGRLGVVFLGVLLLSLVENGIGLVDGK